MTGIKLCGLMRTEDIETANRLLPEYVGFVFYPKSRRGISVEQAEEFRCRLDTRIQVVGVFVGEKTEKIAQLCQRGIVQLPQLHGGESEEEVLHLRQLLPAGIPIIKAFSVCGEGDLEAAEKTLADYPLLDQGKGGTGHTFDYELLIKRGGMKRPYFLAGGLNPENVEQILELVGMVYAVDVSSGIETDGKKDACKMEAFVRKVRGEEDE